jgi:hypothetical protein
VRELATRTSTQIGLRHDSFDRAGKRPVGERPDFDAHDVPLCQLHDVIFGHVDAHIHRGNVADFHNRLAVFDPMPHFGVLGRHVTVEVRLDRVFREPVFDEVHGFFLGAHLRAKLLDLLLARPLENHVPGRFGFAVRRLGFECSRHRLVDGFFRDARLFAQRLHAFEFRLGVFVAGPGRGRSGGGLLFLGRKRLDRLVQLGLAHEKFGLGAGEFNFNRAGENLSQRLSLLDVISFVADELHHAPCHRTPDHAAAKRSDRPHVRLPAENRPYLHRSDPNRSGGLPLGAGLLGESR